MSDLTDQDRRVLLKLARSVIGSELVKGSKAERPKEISPAMAEKRGCFVTLHKKGALRGCIGTIEPIKPLISCVEDNALNAAFGDPRFSRLTESELSEVDIEVSVLTVPQFLDYKDPDDLKAKLKPGIHGLILSKGWNSATFLPQVWEQLPDKEAFLAHLCQKAGMSATCWKDKELVVKTYEAEYFSEHELLQKSP